MESHRNARQAKIIIYDQTHSCLRLFPRVFALLIALIFLFHLLFGSTCNVFLSIEYIQISIRNKTHEYRRSPAIMRKGLSIHQNGKRERFFSLLYNPTPNSRLIDIDFLISLHAKRIDSRAAAVVLYKSNTLQCVTSDPIRMESTMTWATAADGDGVRLNLNMNFPNHVVVSPAVCSISTDSVACSISSEQHSPVSPY